ncbi:hypothetical protein [Rheinheimera sp.]|uniref:hypothetical protein n=1 Tax=Rheinheimera sp. TaxID=1869214 RepID=UPI00307CFE42
MLTMFYQAVSLTHIILGTAALLLFWWPVLSKKGSAVHRRTGHYYSLCMHSVAASGIVMTLLVWGAPLAAKPELMARALTEPQLYQRLMDQNSFLFLLSLLTWVTIRHAQLALKTRQDRRLLRHWAVLGPVLLLVAVSAAVLRQQGAYQPLVLVFSLISLGTAAGILRYTFARNTTANAWLVEHAVAMLASGIAAYTAFSAFGGRVLLSSLLQGYWQMLPWLLPTLIGLPAIFWYRRKLNQAS